MQIDIIHTTRYSYDEPIIESTMRAWLQPRTDKDQRRMRFELVVEPNTEIFSYTDGFGNTIHCFSVIEAHRSLLVIARSRVETLLANPFAPVEPAAPEPDRTDTWPFLQFGGAVSRVAEVEHLAQRFRPQEPENTWDALNGLMHYIHEAFEYQPEVTTVTSTVEDLLALRKGVCQDFTHLMIAVCRAMEIPARYMSGYIFSSAENATRGGGASHAWCEALIPGLGWRGFDPTNDVLAAESHVKVGQGRSYTDVPPTRGIYRGAAQEHIEVTVLTERA